jgi:hypothetical protein
LALAAPVRDQFRSIKLVAPLKQSLTAKKQSLDAAVLAYKQVAEYQVAETTTAATYETAELYRTLAHDLLSSQRPGKLSGEALEQYNALLDEQSFPFEEQAIAIHEINVKRAQDGVYDDSVRRSFAALAELKPARYGKTELSASWLPLLTAASGNGASGASPTAAAQADFQRVTDLATAGKDNDAIFGLMQFEQQHPGFATQAIDLGLLTRRLERARCDAAAGGQVRRGARRLPTLPGGGSRLRAGAPQPGGPARPVPRGSSGCAAGDGAL